MKTQDLFAINRTAKKLNETIEKTFGKKLNLEAFDLTQLEDARNKLRTQVHQARVEAGFNENLENEALTQAQWMLDAINAELEERQELIADAHTAEIEVDDTNEGFGSLEEEVIKLLKRFEENAMEIGAYGDPDVNKIIALLQQGDAEEAVEAVWYSYSDQDGGEVPQIEPYIEDLKAEFEVLAQGGDADTEPDDATDDGEALASAGHGSDEDYGTFPESAPPTAKGERMVKHIKAGYSKDGELTDKEKSTAYATAWKQHNKDKNESIEGDNMTNLKEGEVQQASAIVSAKTMVDRVGRWIEDLSGMENDTLLTLGDSIRDEMSQELAKQFISQAAPALQQAIEILKQTRDTLASSVRVLTGEEQGAEMIGAEPTDAGADMEAPAEPDALNAAPEGDVGAVAPEDEFAAAEPAAGGLGDAGRAKRESIERSNSLLRVLAG
jgi:mannose/fructose-specific phosphotransferase system component IIA